jgi:urea transporter
MILIAISPVFLPAFVHAKLIKQDSIIEASIYAAVFAVITGAWIQYLSLILKFDFRKMKHFLFFPAVPLAALALVKFYAIFTDKPCGKDVILASFTSILIVLLISRFILARKFGKVH